MLPPFPAFLSLHRLSVAPHHATETKKLPSKRKKNLGHSGANDWELNAKPVAFLQDLTNGLSPKAPKATS